VTTADVVAFDASDAEGDIEYYQWDFDDGSGNPDETTTYSFREPGTYEVTLTVYEGIGGPSDSATQTITVGDTDRGPDDSTDSENGSETDEMVDSDGDGLPDTLEEEGVPVQYTVGPDSEPSLPVTTSIELDPDDPDTDGDGVPDGYEVVVDNLSIGLDGTERYDLRSLPDETDSDGDGLPDGTENETGLDPLNPDTDGDSLDDKLEYEGIPVTDWYDYGDAGESANTTNALPGPDDDAVKTDPLDPDTDGDGLSDGLEVGSDTIQYQEFTVYQLQSDPTDPNTDDAGLNDSAELAQGSDPTTPEYASVKVTVPVTGEQGCRTTTSDDLVRNCAKEFYSRHVTANLGNFPYHELRPKEQYNAKRFFDEQRQPGWLSDVPVEDGEDYYLVNAVVETTYENVPPDERPDYVAITGVNGINAELGKEVSVSLPEESTKTVVPIVIEAEDDWGAQEVGKLQIRVDVEDGSIIDRGDGGNAVFETQTPLMIKNNVAFTSEEAARDMVTEATRKWSQNTITAVVPTGGAVSKVSLGGGAGVGAKLYIDGVATLSGVDTDGPLSKPGQDELIAEAIVAEGTVPAYLNRDTETPPITNIVALWYREA